LRMRRSSSIRCRNGVIGETSTDYEIRNRAASETHAGGNTLGSACGFNIMQISEVSTKSRLWE
jgi:hypothetical protein